MADAALSTVLDTAVNAVEKERNSQHKISINQVVEQLNEDDQQTESSAQATQRWHYPGDRGRESSPSEPKQPNSKEHAAKYDRRTTPLGNRNTAVCVKLLVVGYAGENDECSTNEQAHDHTEQGQAANARIHAVHPLENNGISCQETIEKTVDETEVNRHS